MKSAGVQTMLRGSPFAAIRDAQLFYRDITRSGVVRTGDRVHTGRLKPMGPITTAKQRVVVGPTRTDEETVRPKKA